MVGKGQCILNSIWDVLRYDILYYIAIPNHSLSLPVVDVVVVA